MFKQTAEAKDNPAAAGLPSRHRGEGMGTLAPNRRGSADSFRMLTARLGKLPEADTPIAEIQVPDIQPEYSPEPAVRNAASHSTPPPEPVFEDPPNIFAPPPVASAAQQLPPPLPDIVLPAFQPLWPLSESKFAPLELSEVVVLEEAQASEPTPEPTAPVERELLPARLAEDLQAFISMPDRQEPEESTADLPEEPVFGILPDLPPSVQTSAEEPPGEPSLAALLQQPVPAAETAASPEQSVSIRPADTPFAGTAPVESRRVTAADPFKVARPFAERVVDTILKNVFRDVFAKPSDDDRAAYLAEAAAVLEEENAASVDIEHSEQPEPPTAPELSQLAWPLPQASLGSVRPPEPSAEELALPLELPLEPPVEPAATAPFSLKEVVASTQRRGRLPKKETKSPDEFAEPVKTDAALDTRQVPAGQADDEAAELARSLLDMMSAGGSAQPQERALAADTLLRLTPRIPVKTLVSVVERLAVMDNPPQLLVAKMIRDPRAEVAAPLLERCMHITDNDLLMAASEGDPSKLRMIARRRALSPALTDGLIANGDPSVLLTLVRNPGASLSHDAYYLLAEHAEHHHGLLAPLTTRADLPAPVAFELFWLVPPELRRFIFSRFLTDSENLNKILKITMAMQNAGAPPFDDAEAQFPDKDLVDGAIDLAIEGKLQEAAGRLAEIGGICKENAERILSDADGEPIAVLFKALGYPRGRVAVTIGRLKQPGCGLLRDDRPTDELQSIFDTLSFNKARILLTYWDWYAQKTGPYASRN